MPQQDDELDILTLEQVRSMKAAERPEEEGYLASGVRQVARTGARAVETIAGLPGDIQSIFNAAGEYVGEFAGDQLRKLVGKEPLTEEQKLEQRQFMQDVRVPFPPTSQELRSGTQALTGEYLEPKGQAEEFADEVVSDLSSMMIPVKGKMPFAKTLGKVLLANAGAEVAKAYAGEEAGAPTKLGLLFATSLIGGKKGGVKKYIDDLYDKMEASAPEGASVSAKGLSSRLDKIKTMLMKGDPTEPTKQAPLQVINSMREKIKDGRINVDELVQFNKDINSRIFKGPLLKRAQNKLYDLRDSTHSALKEYGKENAEFLANWKYANEAYAATETSRKIGNFFRKTLKPKDYLYAGSALGLEKAFAGTTLGAQTAAGLGAAAGVGYTAEVLKRIAQSPALRTYYGNVVKSALKENSKAFARNMKLLDKGLKESFDESPYKLVDFED